MGKHLWHLLTIFCVAGVCWSIMVRPVAAQDEGDPPVPPPPTELQPAEPIPPPDQPPPIDGGEPAAPPPNQPGEDVLIAPPPMQQQPTEPEPEPEGLPTVIIEGGDPSSTEDDIVGVLPHGQESDIGEDLDPIVFALQLTFTGMGVVFLALLLLSFLIGLSQRFLAPPAEPEVEISVIESTPTPSTIALPSGDGLTPETMAAITAAITVAIGSRYRIKRIRYLEDHAPDAWSRQGRVTIMTSHRGSR